MLSSIISLQAPDVCVRVGATDGSTGPWDSRQTLDGKQQRSATRLNNTLTSGWAGCRTQTVCVEREKRVGEVWGEFKGIVDPKTKNLSLSNHPHLIQNSWNTKGLFTLATVNSPSLKKGQLKPAWAIVPVLTDLNWSSWFPTLIWRVGDQPNKQMKAANCCRLGEQLRPGLSCSMFQTVHTSHLKSYYLSYSCFMISNCTCT